MIDCLSIVETDKGNHVVETDIVKLLVEIESFGMSSDKFSKEIRLFDGLQPKQADLNCVHALNELHLHEIHVFSKEIGSSDGLQPKQADLNCVHALNELHLHEIHVVPNVHVIE
ncbi:hypothetical protein Tco_0448381 [Tanacetum coccineum]